MTDTSNIDPSEMDEMDILKLGLDTLAEEQENGHDPRVEHPAPDGLVSLINATAAQLEEESAFADLRPGTVVPELVADLAPIDDTALAGAAAVFYHRWYAAFVDDYKRNNIRIRPIPPHSTNTFEDWWYHIKWEGSPILIAVGPSGEADVVAEGFYTNVPGVRVDIASHPLNRLIRSTFTSEEVIRAFVAHELRLVAAEQRADDRGTF